MASGEDMFDSSSDEQQLSKAVPEERSPFGDEESADSQPDKNEDDDHSEASSDSEELEEDLDEEDRELLEENIGLTKRDRSEGGQGKFKRLKRRAVKEESEDEALASDDDEEEEEEEKEEDELMVEVRRQRLKKRSSGADLERLFEDDEEAAEQDLEDDDDLADFIEDDGDEDGQKLVPRKKPAPRTASGAARFGSFASTGVSRDRLQDMADIFGDGSEYAHAMDVDVDVDVAEEKAEGRGRRRKGVDGSEMNTLELHRVILEADIPERFQMRDGVDRAKPTEDELEREASWIVGRLRSAASSKLANAECSALHAAVKTVLRLLRMQMMEVPFIATHRKEYFQSLLGLNELWMIMDEDEQWKLLSSQKDHLLSLLANVNDASHAWRLAEFVSSCGSMELLDVAADFVRKVLPPPQSGSSAARIIHKRTEYDLAKDAAVDSLISSFCLSALQFTENVRAGHPVNKPPEPDSPDVEGVAVGLISDLCPTGRQVTKAATIKASTELGLNPVVFEQVQAALLKSAAVNVLPSEKGRLEITMLHEFAGIKYIAAKPVHSFQEDQFFLLQKASNAGLLSFEVVFTELEAVKDGLFEMWNGVGVEDVNEWSLLRKQILDHALAQHILPRVLALLVAKLAADTERWIAQCCQYSLQDKLMIAPYNPDKVLRLKNRSRQRDDDAQFKVQDVSSSRVLAVSWGSGSTDTATMAVVVDGSGRVLDQGKFPKLQDRFREVNKADWKRLFDFATDHRPSAIVVAGTSPSTRELYDGIMERLTALKRTEEGRPLKDVVVVFGEDDAARVYQNSARASRDFSEYPQLLKYCVSLGRRWVNPLFELASLSDEELAQISLHQHQSQISKDVLLKYLHRGFINVVNLVGVDINMACSNAWARAPLRFVCGLGPVKSAALIRSIGQLLVGSQFVDPLKGGKVGRRWELQAKELIGPCVYANCASFFRIVRGSSRDRGAGKSDFDPLDDTRIHPENYSLARKMACDALEIALDDGGESDSLTDETSQAVADVMEQPEKLNDLLLDEYAKELEKRLHTPKHLTLLDIKAELQAPYADLRTVSAGAPPDTVFEMLTGETERSLYHGQRVHARITKHHQRHVACRLDSGVNGSIDVKHLPRPQGGSRFKAANPSLVVRPSQTVVAAVVEVDLARLLVELSMLPEDLAEPREPRGGFDPYYDFERARKDLVSRLSKAAPPGTKPDSTDKPAPPLKTRRMIAHPAFRDASRDVAEKMLATPVVGEVIIRPSGSKGSDHLALTWKVDEAGLFQHIDIEEKNRPNEYSLGQTLIVGGEKFEDLDEIIARYVEPIMAFIQDARSCSKFVKLQTADREESRRIVERHLEGERGRNPTRISYCLSLSRDRPGSLLMSYQPGSKPYHELVHVTPAGYQLRHQNFDRLDSLIGWFKQHYRDRPAAAGAPTGEGGSPSSDPKRSVYVK